MYPCTKFHLIWRTSDFVGPNFPKENINDKNLKKQTLKSKQAYGNLPLYQVSVNLKNFRFWDQLCPNNMKENNFEKINIKVVISIWQFTPVPNFSQFGELQIYKH